MACDLHVLTPGPGGPRHSFGLDEIPRQAGRVDGPALAEILQVLQGPKTKVTERWWQSCWARPPGMPRLYSARAHSRARPGLPGLLWPILATVCRMLRTSWAEVAVSDAQACWFRPPRQPTASSQMVSGPSQRLGQPERWQRGWEACRLCLCPGWGVLGEGKEETPLSGD